MQWDQPQNNQNKTTKTETETKTNTRLVVGGKMYLKTIFCFFLQLFGEEYLMVKYCTNTMPDKIKQKKTASTKSSSFKSVAHINELRKETNQRRQRKSVSCK